jgi:hypothetical protein
VRGFGFPGAQDADGVLAVALDFEVDAVLDFDGFGVA